jgi:hypothetical protein
VLTREGKWLSDSERDELWRLFQVPVYALMVRGDASVVAWECEAQNGMHFNEGGDTCACGRPGAKLMLRTRRSYSQRAGPAQRGIEVCPNSLGACFWGPKKPLDPALILDLIWP